MGTNAGIGGHRFESKVAMGNCELELKILSTTTWLTLGPYAARSHDSEVWKPRNSGTEGRNYSELHDMCGQPSPRPQHP